MPSGTIVDNEKDVYGYPSRSSRNSKLYREVYGKYENLDNLPLDDNTDEIDMERLRELVYNTENTHEYRELRDNLDIIDIKKRNIDTERVHDINKILEKAKYENNKLKEPVVNTNRNKSILSTLQMNVIKSEDSDSLYQEEVVSKVFEDNDNIYMTREFKFKELNDKISELNSNPLIDNVMEDNALSLDLFEDLKPVGDTIITEPIIEREEVNSNYNNDYKGDMYSSDTSDIDVIKDIPNTKKSKKIDEDFFTNSYEFSKKDFNSNNEEEFFEEKNGGGSVIKIILLLLAIAVFIFVIVYFVMNYGIGV